MIQEKPNKNESYKLLTYLSKYIVRPNIEKGIEEILFLNYFIENKTIL